MTAIQFVKATKKRAKARIAIDGPAGAGKTYTALKAAQALAQGGKIAGVDTEHASMSLYSDLFDFDVMELTEYNPQNYIDAIHAAENGGYSVVVLDSLSHAWEGKGGVLELHDQAVMRQRTENSYTAWRDVTPLHRDLVEAILASPIHIVATMRSKMDYVQEKDANGKTKITKIGLAPVQRQGMEYEFTLVADMDVDHSIVISKSRCNVMADKVSKKPDVPFWTPLVDWLNSGEATPELTPDERKAKAEAAAAVANAEKERAAAAEAAEVARKAGYATMCQRLVDDGYYPAKANVTATMKLLHLSYTLAKNDEILAALIANATAIDAAMKEVADAAETTGSAEGTDHPVAEGAPELP